MYRVERVFSPSISFAFDISKHWTSDIDRTIEPVLPSIPWRCRVFLLQVLNESFGTPGIKYRNHKYRSRSFLSIDIVAKSILIYVSDINIRYPISDIQIPIPQWVSTSWVSNWKNISCPIFIFYLKTANTPAVSSTNWLVDTPLGTARNTSGHVYSACILLRFVPCSEISSNILIYVLSVSHAVYL